MPINSPVVTEIGIKTYHINEFGLSSIYLLVGKKRALLIDTGAGFCDLKMLIRRLTPLPYDVVLTHGHVGHSGGMKQFKEIYVHPFETENCLGADNEEKVKFASHPRNTEEGRLWTYTKPQVAEFEAQPVIQELYEGLEFDLGGRVVKTISTPGHTMGSCSFLDEYTRIIFTGDACEKMQFVTSCAVSTMVRGLFNIRRHRNSFDQIYGGHVNYVSAAITRSTREKTLLDNITACRCILEKSAVPEKYVHKDGKEYMFVKIGTVQLIYDQDNLWEPGENLSPIPIGM